MGDQPTKAVDRAENVRNGTTKAVDVVNEHLARIDARDGEINAFNLVLADQAREPKYINIEYSPRLVSSSHHAAVTSFYVGRSRSPNM